MIPQDGQDRGSFRTTGRKSSATVVVGALSALSLAVAGCGSPDTVTARCVDDDRRSDGSYRVVDEDRCDDDSGTGRTGGYFYYYGGNASGGSVSGGTRARPSDAKVVTESGKVIQRGGMGGRGGGGGRVGG
ncbi:hypothetical protein [Nocardiopsis baichengensis]|uniref:hypothetical protein n=1 Tax=Nocardiopsis baichengensis TaxID=280240 RepID=UPI00034AAFAF|nr:hypothetical protein [Nocardiopsis baichengensis]